MSAHYGDYWVGPRAGLKEMQAMTGIETHPASFEPTIDYVVTKVPRFAFEKFPGVPGCTPLFPHRILPLNCSKVQYTLHSFP